VDETSRVFPNPTVGEIFLPPYQEVTIINSTGTIILKKEGAQSPISISDCAPGLYIVILDGQVFRVIKI
jgi:hypothetical protein